jgi:hypothetical protein
MGKAEELLQGWLRHRKVFLELLELFDDEHLNFKPWERSHPPGIAGRPHRQFRRHVHEAREKRNI